MKNLLNKSSKILLSVVLATGTFSNLSCYIENTLSYLNQTKQTREEKIKTQPLIIGIEGAFVSGYVIHNLTARIANDLGLAQSAGKSQYNKHLEYAEKSYQNRNKIIGLGFSWGCGRIRDFAEDCKKRNIPIELIIYLDATYLSETHPKEIPSNVEKVINYMSDKRYTSRGLRGREIIKEDCENPSTIIENHEITGTEHVTLPKSKELEEMIKQEIRDILKD